MGPHLQPTTPEEKVTGKLVVFSLMDLKILVDDHHITILYTYAYVLPVDRTQAHLNYMYKVFSVETFRPNERKAFVCAHT